MPVILRRDKGSTLTHSELDDNFQELLNRANLDSDLVKKFTLDSADAIALIDSDYIQYRRPPEAVFGVSNNGTAAWRFNGDGFPTGVDNPTLYLHRGLEYKFEINALGHPLEFRLSNGGTVYSAGVTGSGTQVGDINFTIPFDAPSSLVYQCANHASMVGDIVIMDNLDSDSVTNLIDSAYIQQRVPESYLETIIDSDYIQARDRFRDSSFVTGIVDSSYVKSFIDSDHVTGLIDSHVTNLIDSSYVNARSSVTTSSVTTSYAGITPLAVGSMLTCNNFNSNPGYTVNIGGTIAGSYLSGINYGSGSYYNIGATGTWKNMGGMRVQYNQGAAPSLFMRIA